MDRRPGALTLSEDDRRTLAPWAADCAERTLPLFEAAVPGDSRPRAALEGLRAFARGDLRIGPARALAVAAHAAARGAGNPAAVAAARACGHAVAVAHMGSHARGAPAYAAHAAGLAAPDDPAAPAREIEAAIEAASPAVRAVLRRLPAPQQGGGSLGAFIRDLHFGIATD